MNTRSVARISCERPLNLTVADRIESALIDPATDLLLIEFRGNPETEGAEVDQILAADPLIDRLRNLLREMEKGTKPVVALLSEPIGGLQFEIALACHVRFSSVETTILNFPWLKYGLMPILGGTQRLPRICGIELAARVLLQTGTLTGADAVASGLLEAKNGPLPEPAIEWAETHPRPMQPWDRLPQELSSTNSQAPSNRRLLEKIYLRLRNHVPP
jgi:3-hydroxyacyl-CoA dehydrogenase / enoyl-CoA hydratase / 3-hydroxybutyryl-CoA epimerase